MRTLGTRPRVRRSRVTPVYAGALAIATVSGLCALFALAAGSPLQFGAAFAMFGGGWIAADFIERTVQRGPERAGHQFAPTASRPRAGDDPDRVVYVGHREQVSSTQPCVVTRAAA